MITTAGEGACAPHNHGQPRSAAPRNFCRLERDVVVSDALAAGVIVSGCLTRRG